MPQPRAPRQAARANAPDFDKPAKPQSPGRRKPAPETPGRQRPQREMPRREAPDPEIPDRKEPEPEIADPDTPLARYQAKRNFARTPEPRGSVAATKAGTLQYVIQKHWASHLHYDLRLEIDGTMHSWAVPKGPSLDPHDKRLAMQVENHPMSYNTFEGQIPPGQYGAGRVIIWDRGSWEPEGDVHAMLRQGQLKFRIHGAKLHGRWALVRMKKDTNAAKPAWLLIKEKDEHARAAAQYSIVDAEPDSVVQTALDLADSSSDDRGSSTSSNTSSRKGTPADPLPEALSPQLATLVSAPPDALADWLWELKFDGYRLLARIDQGKARLFTRNGLDWTHRMPELAAALARLPVRQAWLDGEVVAVDDEGMPDFAALQNAFDGAGTKALVYYLFDLLHLDGTDWRTQALRLRREQLDLILMDADEECLRLSQAFEAAPADLIASACRMGMEGIIGKRREAHYTSGRNQDWIKLKCGQGEELVIAGYTEGQGARADLGALVLAAHDAKGALRHAGNVGSGFDTRTLAMLLQRLQALETAESPLTDSPRLPGRIHWVRPELVAQVTHAGWTPQRKLRHGVFRGLREDKPAAEVRFERAVAPPKEEPGQTEHPQVSAATRSKAQRTAPTGTPSAKPASASFSGITITHPDRVIDASTGLQKIDLARYYQTVAPLLLPHLDLRPVALVRAPDGIAGELFFQKHLERISLPGVVLLDPALDPGHASLLEIENEAGLMGAVQMNVIELHTWNARHDRIERPDRFTLDLDPGEGVPWERVQEAARLVHTLLTELGLQPFLKTSGGKGLHVVTPIKRLHDWDTVKGFSKLLAEHLARLMPDRFSALSGPKNRVGKIYPDYLRNGRGATTVSAWSARARAGLGVSVPVSWNELDKLTGGAHWTVATVEDRLRLGNGPWADYKQSARSIGEPLRQLQAIAKG